MTADETKKLQLLLKALADPKGNLNHAWKNLCELAYLDPQTNPPNLTRVAGTVTDGTTKLAR
jgi:hypothetical protein